jgi:hypothetical protein
MEYYYIADFKEENSKQGGFLCPSNPLEQMNNYIGRNGLIVVIPRQVTC